MPPKRRSTYCSTHRQRATPSGETLRSLFSLTQQEYIIATALAGGFGAKEIAESRHLNYETVRTHVKNIMRKMGVSRQAEITALLATLSRA